MTETMGAVRLHEYGGPEGLVYEEDVPRPEPGEGEVLIRVRAAAVNAMDWKIRSGYLKEAIPYQFPLTLGLDVAGVVEAVGPGVSEFRPGQDVFGMLDDRRLGGYARYAVAPASQVAPKPRSLGFVESAALPTVALTAWQALFERANLEDGQRVLVHGAAGGVGHVAVQLAKWKGAHVVGTALGRDVGFLRDLGADEAVDYTQAPFEEAIREKVDAALSGIDGGVVARSLAVLKEGGVLVSFATPPPAEPSAETAAARGVRLEQMFVRPDGGQLAEIAAAIDAAGGSLAPRVARTLPLEEARKAHEPSATGDARGKIVLEVG